MSEPMARAEKYSAFQFSAKKISAVELAHHSDEEMELLTLAELKTSTDFSEIFSSPSSARPEHVRLISGEVSAMRKSGRFGSKNISFCLDSDWVFTHSFPLDDSLSEPEREEQVGWELSNYLGESPSTKYITDLAILGSPPSSGTSLILSASVQRDLVMLLRGVATSLGLNLAVIEVDHYGAEHALVWSYPELKDETVGLLSVRPDRLDASLIVRGKPARYRWTEIPGNGGQREFLEEFFSSNLNGDLPLRRLFVYGENLIPSHLENFRFREALSVEPLDPIRKLALPRKMRRMERMFFQKYAPLIGIAMRKE